MPFDASLDQTAASTQTIQLIFYFYITPHSVGRFLGGGLILSRRRTVSPGNANLPIGGGKDANREIGVPGALLLDARVARVPIVRGLVG